jgi:hypothetical protein
LEGGLLLSLLGLTAFMITFLIPLISVLSVWSLGEWRLAWGQAFRQGPQDTKVSAEIWKFREFTSYLAGILALLVGGILILGDFGSGQVTWNHALGAALVGPTYGTLFGLICRILRARVLHQQA